MASATQKISEEEFDRLETERRHKDLLKALSSIVLPDSARVEAGLSAVAGLIEKLIEKDVSPDLSKLDTTEHLLEIQSVLGEIKQLLTKKPVKGFKIERDGNGFIERVVVE